MIWIFFVVLTAAALALVFRPMLSAASSEDFSAEATNYSHELEVYKDQLREVENDLKQGMLTKAEVEAARLEISRRMLACVDGLEKASGKKTSAKMTSQKEKSGSSKKHKPAQKAENKGRFDGLQEKWDGLGENHKTSLLASVIGVSVLALGLYGGLGSPGDADQPYAKRFAKKVAAPLVKKAVDLTAHLEKNPKDGKSWEKLAAVYMSKNSFHKAAFSFRQAMKYLGENTSRLTGFAEATIMLNKGKVTEPAVAAYQRALKLDPELVEPRVRLAMGMEQRGDVANAVKGYRDIIRRSSKNAPWMPFIEKRLAKLTGKPVKRKLTAEDQKIIALIGKVEESLKKNPDAGRGWDVIAPVYLSRGDYKKSINAFQKAIALLGENAKRFSGLGEATTLLNNGTISPKAEAYFKKALKLDPAIIEPRIRLAMGLEQKGSLKEAQRAYQEIIERGGKKTPWYAIIKQRVDIVTAQLTGKAGKGPTAQQMRDAQSMSKNDKQSFINQMVARLASKLEDDGNDLGGWLKLMNAYNVQGRKSKVMEAYGKARRIFKGNSQALAQLDVAVKNFGL